MKRLYSSSDLILVTQLKRILETEGIPCVVRNEVLGSLAGEIPFSETFPELWIQNDTDLQKAEAIKRDWKAVTTAPGKTWTCPNCGEQLEPQFCSCWNCGTAKTEQTAVV